MICRLIFTLAVAMWAGPQPVPGADQQLHDLAIRALELETRALQWDTYWLNSPPPADYRPGDETEVEFFFPESRDAVGFCSPAFGWCSLLMAVDGELYNRGGWKFDESCGRECRIQRFQEEYLGAPRPLKTALSIGKADEPRFFDPNNLSLAREAAKTDKVSFDLSLTKSWVLLLLLEMLVSRSDGPPKNYAGLRKVVADYTQSDLGGRCGDTAQASIPRYVDEDRKIYVRYQFGGGCKNRVALFSYTFGDWSRLLDINDPNDARDAIKRIDEILMERITVTASARAIPD